MLVVLTSLWFNFSLAVTVKLPKFIAWLLLFVLILFVIVDVVFISLKIMEDPSDAVLVVIISVLPAFVPNMAFVDWVEFAFALADCRNADANCWLWDWLDDTTTLWIVLFTIPWTAPPPALLLWGMGTILTTFVGLICAKNCALARLFFRLVYKMRVRSIWEAIWNRKRGSQSVQMFWGENSL